MTRLSNENLENLRFEYQQRSNEFLSTELIRLKGMIGFRLERYPSILSKTKEEDVKELVIAQKSSLDYLRKAYDMTLDILINHIIK